MGSEYRRYTREALTNGSLPYPIGCHIFIRVDVDKTILEDQRIMCWASRSGVPVTVDPRLWDLILRTPDRGRSYPHPAAVDCADSSVLVIRDSDLADSFEDEFCRPVPVEYDTSEEDLNG